MSEKTIGLEAIRRGRDALAHSPPVVPTPALTMAASLLPPAGQQRVLEMVGPIGGLPTIMGGQEMAGPFKVVWAFTGPDGGLWTEVYHTSTGTPFTLAHPPDDVVNQRLAFLSPQCAIAYVQATDLSTPKASYRSYRGAPGTFPGSGAASNVGELADCHIYRVFAADYTYVQKFFRGIPHICFQRDARGTEQSGAAEALIRAFTNSLPGMGYGWLTVTPVDRTPLAQYAWNEIKKAEELPAPGLTTLTLASPITLSTQKQVYISKCDQKLLPGINGIWNATSPAEGQITIRYQLAQGATVLSPKGRLRVYTSTFRGFVNTIPVAFEGFGSRRTRENFTRGRRGPSAKGIRTLV